jgi:hypothetical protein
MKAYSVLLALFFMSLALGLKLNVSEGEKQSNCCPTKK